MYNQNMKNSAKTILCAVCALLVSVAASCSGVIGHSVVLWNIGEEKISDGTIVPVYLKSNISHVYVITAPGSDEKIEVPLWKLSEPSSKGKANRLVKQYKDYEHKYARCKLDGLPIRQEPVNTARQIYRLREGEIIRTLEKGEGTAPTNGTSNLQGDWLHVLTSNGVKGWCFSLNLELFEMSDDGSYDAGGGQGSGESEADNLLEDVLTEKWYPDYFDSMRKKGRIDLEYVKPSYGFDPGKESGTVSVNLPGVSISYPFTQLTKTGKGIYDYKDTSIHLTIKDENTINVRFTDSEGKTRSQNFVSSAVIGDSAALIASERNRRTNAFASLRTAGPDFSSSNYGMISFASGNRFTWSGYSLVEGSVVPEGSGANGSVSFAYFLPQNLKESWNGIMTLTFDKNGAEVNLLYKIEGSSLRLTPARVVTIKNASTGFNESTVSKSSGSLEMYFRK